jgi:hypothetical protein
MNIIFLMVGIASVAFLLRFLGALIHEQRSVPHLPKAHLLNESLVTKGGRVRSFTRVKLQVVEPKELTAQHAYMGGARVTQVEKWG